MLDHDLQLAKGLSWSPDGCTLSSIGTLAESLCRRDHGAGAIGARALFAVGASFDGMSVDSRGNVWVVVWVAGEVRCFDPAGTPVPESVIRVAVTA